MSLSARVERAQIYRAAPPRHLSGVPSETRQRLPACGRSSQLRVGMLASVVAVAALFSWLQGQRVDVKGWEVSMDQLQQGRLSALQRGPDSALMELKIILER